MVRSLVRHFLYDFSHTVDSVTWPWTRLADLMGVGSRLQGCVTYGNSRGGTEGPQHTLAESTPGILSLGLLQICAVAGGCSSVAQVKARNQSQGSKATILTSKSSILLGMDFHVHLSS